MSGYYLIGYQPQRGDFEAPDGAPRFHSIEVKVKRAGLQVRSRSGFFGMPELDLPVMPDSRTEQLRKALYSPFQGAIEVRLNASYSATGRDEKTGRRGAVLKGSLLIDARNLRFQDRPDGKKQVTLDVVGAAFGADGKMVANDDKTFTAVLTPEEWRETLATGLLYRMGTPISKPGGYQFRVALRDAASGQTGSASAFVEIPDFNQPRLALSSLDLAEKNQVTRMFRPGAMVRFDCDVYGARRDDTGKPRVEFEVRLFHGAERIFSGRPVPVAGQEAAGEANTQVAASGDMRLPESLPAGDYAMELVVYDRLATGKNEAASQWSDFSIVR
jgi:hypothetical protein